MRQVIAVSLFAGATATCQNAEYIELSDVPKISAGSSYSVAHNAHNGADKPYDVSIAGKCVPTDRTIADGAEGSEAFCKVLSSADCTDKCRWIAAPLHHSNINGKYHAKVKQNCESSGTNDCRDKGDWRNVANKQYRLKWEGCYWGVGSARCSEQK